eukprot:PhF_6_TR17258/c0_g1_i1/m.26470
MTDISPIPQPNADWRAVRDKQGKIYYYNIYTKRTLRDVPPELIPSTTVSADSDDMHVRDLTERLSKSLEKNLSLSAELDAVKEERAQLGRMLQLYQTRLQSIREGKCVSSYCNTLRVRTDEFISQIPPELLQVVEPKLQQSTTADEICVCLDSLAAMPEVSNNTELLGAVLDYKSYFRSNSECEALNAKIETIRGSANKTIESLTSTLKSALKRLAECGQPV